MFDLQPSTRWGIDARDLESGPNQRRRSPGESTAERSEDDSVAGLDAAGKVGECEWDGGRAGVADAIDVEDDLVARQADLVGDRVEDARVGLMPDQPVDVADAPPGPLDHRLGRARHAL
jgi:hypothetical protein